MRNIKDLAIVIEFPKDRIVRLKEVPSGEEVRKKLRRILALIFELLSVA